MKMADPQRPPSDSPRKNRADPQQAADALQKVRLLFLRVAKLGTRRISIAIGVAWIIVSIAILSLANPAAEAEPTELWEISKAIIFIIASMLVLSGVFVILLRWAGRSEQKIQTQLDQVDSLARELRQIAEMDRRWNEASAGTSVLPDGKYQISQGDLYLVDPSPNPLDDQLRKLVRRFVQADAAKQSDVRDSMNGNDDETLITFANRCAIFGLREQNLLTITDGLRALSLLDRKRVDTRDIVTCLGLLRYAAGRLSNNPARHFEEIATHAEPDLRKLFHDFVNGPMNDRELQIASGYAPIETAQGIGFANWGTGEYSPTIDLKSAALEVALLLKAANLQPVRIQFASKLTASLLTSDSNPELIQILSRLRGVVEAQAISQPEQDETDHETHLSLFITETADEQDAARLVEFCQRGRKESQERLAVASGKLFELLVTETTDPSVSQLLDYLAERLAKSSTR